MYKGEADWDLISQVKHNSRMHIPVFGNGDINSPQKAVEYKNRYGVDGVMIGRASIGNPWFFKQVKHFIATGEELGMPSIEERVDVVKKHLEMSLEWKGEREGIVEMRRHYSNYFKGIPDFKPVRMKLVTSFEVEEIFDTLQEVKREFSSVL